jgi:hypothetical protein
MWFDPSIAISFFNVWMDWPVIDSEINVKIFMLSHISSYSCLIDKFMHFT